jgi:hypothetical protein
VACAFVAASLVRPVYAAPIKVDFVFVIDVTSSMGGEIAGVRNGFAQFVSDLNTAGVDARYGVVLFGDAPELYLDMTSDATVAQNYLGDITIGPNNSDPIKHLNHNSNPEAGLEAIRAALGDAAAETYTAARWRPYTGNTTDPIAFRDDAQINIILATDEDSDSPYWSDNRTTGQPGGAGDDPENTNPPSTGPNNAGWDPWQAEIDATAQAVIDSGAFLNMLVNVGDTPSGAQYGDPTKDVSDADFLNFNPAATLAALLADDFTNESLQAQVLSAGLIARSFAVSGANDEDFVNNFFAAKVQEVTTPREVPEPATLGLIVVSLAGLGFARRRFKA